MALHLPQHADRINPKQGFVDAVANNTELYAKFFDFGNAIRFGSIPDRDREVVILRTAWNCRCAYQWGQHFAIATSALMTTDEIAAIARVVPDPQSLDNFDLILIRVADQLHKDSSVDDETWVSLSERYDPSQLIELPMLVGTYHMLAYFMNAVGIPPESGVEPLPPG
jgi:4-carboxymuconolactone decarboxylase